MGVAISAQAGGGEYVYKHLAALNAGGTVVNLKASAGVLYGVVINTKGASSNTLTLYDATAIDTSLPICVIDTTVAPGLFAFNAQFTLGLAYNVATGTAADITILYR